MRATSQSERVCRGQRCRCSRAWVHLIRPTAAPQADTKKAWDRPDWYNDLRQIDRRRVTRSTLARVNEQKPHMLYGALSIGLYVCRQSQFRGCRFRLRYKLYSLDSNLIDLSLVIFFLAPHAHNSRGDLQRDRSNCYSSRSSSIAGSSSPRHVPQRVTDADMDRTWHLPASGVAQVYA